MTAQASVRLDSIVRFLNRELSMRSIPDQSRNGLQVRASSGISKVGLAADASMDTFRRAKELGCNLMVVHHGIFWKGDRDTAGLVKKRLNFLKKSRISLYAAHLPLDKNKKFGHNAYLFRILGAMPKESFGGVSYLGYLKKPRDVRAIAKELNKKLGTKCRIWKFGRDKAKRIAVMSGAGSSDILEAIRKRADLFVTGEAFSWAYNNAKEGRINVIIAGHYETETSGVRALGGLLEQRFGLKTVFIDLPPDL
jgi:dinuclear metal center YbgI/SA1388 family protein